MKFAIVPSVDEQLHDHIFPENINPEDKSVPTYFITGLKREIEKRGDEIHTIDMYKNAAEIDYCLLDWPRWKWIAALSNKGLLNRTIYCNAEPVSVLPDNCPKGYRKLKKIYPYILTWNSEWTDERKIFKKNIPYPFYVNFGEDTLDGGELSHEGYEKRKLLTAITTEKFSDTEGELYSERRRVYTYFETHYPNDFTFYGTRWKAEEHPGYGGAVKDKTQTFHGYKFAICLENTRGAHDYVTEKIYDCLCAGIVPIYGGTANICEYVPKECFIDYFSFSDYEEMINYLKNMSEEEYMQYRRAIYSWLEGLDKTPYSIETYVDYLYKVVEYDRNLKDEDRFRNTFGIKIYVNLRGLKEQIRQVLVDIKHKTIG